MIFPEGPPPGRAQELTQPGDANRMSQRNVERLARDVVCATHRRRRRNRAVGGRETRLLGQVVLSVSRGRPSHDVKSFMALRCTDCIAGRSRAPWPHFRRLKHKILRRRRVHSRRGMDSRAVFDADLAALGEDATLGRSWTE